MGDLFFGTSFLAAFLAGVAALFAPCCLTVLLPSYFGSIFREKKKVFLMTFLFFLGVLTVFLPLGLGIAAVGQFFSQYHYAIFSLAGVFFLVLGALLLLGIRMSLPFSLHPTLERHNAGSVYVLGVFSGIATTCCAPVLAGVVALSVLPGSMALGVVYTLAYVLGMVAPLFILAALLDRADLSQRLMANARAREFRIFGREIRITVPELVAGLTFLVMGFLTLRFARENVASHTALQLKINLYIVQLQRFLNGYLGFLPQYAWALLFLAIFLGLVVVSLKTMKKENEEPQR